LNTIHKPENAMYHSDAQIGEMINVGARREGAEHAMKTLIESTSDLDKAVSVLYDRLVPVLRPAEDPSPGRNVEGGLREDCAPMHRELIAQTERVNLILRFIKQITDRVDL
jgi:hypothetical protein